MEIRHLKLIKTAAEEGSLTKATNILHLSQSALSHQLKEIESQINTPVFLRVNKRLVLTDAGKILLNTATNVLNELKQSEIELKRSFTGEVGEIRLRTDCYTCYHWLPQILKNYSFDYPNIEVAIITENNNKPIDQLLNAKLDVAIINRKIGNDNIEYQKLFDDELVLVVSRDHALNKKKIYICKGFRRRNTYYP